MYYYNRVSTALDVTERAFAVFICVNYRPYTLLQSFFLHLSIYNAVLFQTYLHRCKVCAARKCKFDRFLKFWDHKQFLNSKCAIPCPQT